MENEILKSYGEFFINSRVFTAVAVTGGLLDPIVTEVVIDVIYGRISDIRKCEDGVYCWIEGFRDFSESQMSIRMTIDNVFFEFEESLNCVMNYMKQRLESGELNSHAKSEYIRLLEILPYDPPLKGILRYYEYLKDKYNRKNQSMERLKKLNKHISSDNKVAPELDQTIPETDEYIVVYEYNDKAPLGSRGGRVFLTHKSEQDYKKGPLKAADVIAEGVSWAQADELVNTLTGKKVLGK